MPNELTDDHIAIDTNIFEHLLNPAVNVEDHIGRLLAALREDDIGLIIDAGRRISAEYQRRFSMHKSVRNQDYLYTLKYWSNPDRIKLEVGVSQQDSLMAAIKRIIPDRDRGKISCTIDRLFVYVAIDSDRVLVTNDRRDIHGEKTARGDRRAQLLKKAKQMHKRNAAIYDSREACDKL